MRSYLGVTVHVQGKLLNLLSNCRTPCVKRFKNVYDITCMMNSDYTISSLLQAYVAPSYALFSTLLFNCSATNRTTGLTPIKSLQMHILVSI